MLVRILYLQNLDQQSYSESEDSTEGIHGVFLFHQLLGTEEFSWLSTNVHRMKFTDSMVAFGQWWRGTLGGSCIERTSRHLCCLKHLKLDYLYFFSSIDLYFAFLGRPQWCSRLTPDSVLAQEIIPGGLGGHHGVPGMKPVTRKLSALPAVTMLRSFHGSFTYFSCNSFSYIEHLS